MNDHAAVKGRGSGDRTLPLAAGMCACVLLFGCNSSKHPRLDPTSVNWVTYDNSSVGYRVPYPDVYTPSASDNGAYVAFRYHRYTPLLVRCVDEQEGKRRGLWFGSAPAEKIQLGGVGGKKYIYTHYDGPFGARMIAYVIPFKGRFLGLEFRTDTNLDPVQQVILRDFSITQ